MKETSYVMIKPEFANNHLVVKEVERRLTNAGLKIVKASYIQYSVEDAKQHYSAHVNKDFYPELEKYITSDIAYGMIVDGENAITTIRSLVGSTKNPAEGTIRYDIPLMLGWELRVTQNVVHASDSVDAAIAEIEIFENNIEKRNSCGL